MMLSNIETVPGTVHCFFDTFISLFYNIYCFQLFCRFFIFSKLKKYFFFFFFVVVLPTKKKRKIQKDPRKNVQKKNNNNDKNVARGMMLERIMESSQHLSRFASTREASTLVLYKFIIPLFSINYYCLIMFYYILTFIENYMIFSLSFPGT